MDNYLTILCNQSALFGHRCILTEATHVFSKDPEVVLISYDKLINGGTGAVIVLHYCEPFLKDTNAESELPPSALHLLAINCLEESSSL